MNVQVLAGTRFDMVVRLRPAVLVEELVAPCTEISVASFAREHPAAVKIGPGVLALGGWTVGPEARLRCS
jgi:hypothetical protein